jgi:hypothetical protein
LVWITLRSLRAQALKAQILLVVSRYTLPNLTASDYIFASVACELSFSWLMFVFQLVYAVKSKALNLRVSEFIVFEAIFLISWNLLRSRSGSLKSTMHLSGIAPLELHVEVKEWSLTITAFEEAPHHIAFAIS